MPPAFNLSQDQTLQFNPSKLASEFTRAPASNPSQNLRPNLLKKPCEHFYSVAPQHSSLAPGSYTHRKLQTPGHPPQVPTPIGCRFLKSSAAGELSERRKARDYTG